MSERCVCCGRRAAAVLVLVKGSVQSRRATCSPCALTVSERAVDRGYADLAAVVPLVSVA